MNRLVKAALAVAALSAALPAARAQTVSKFESQSSTRTQEDVRQRTQFGPGGTSQTTTQRDLARDSVSQFSGTTTSPGRVTIDAGASRSQLRESSLTNTRRGPLGSVTTGAKSSVEASQSQRLRATLTPTGADIALQGTQRLTRTGETFQGMRTPFGESFDRRRTTQDDVRRTVDRIRR